MDNDKDNKIFNIKTSIKNLLIKEFTKFINDKCIDYKYDHTINYNIKNVFNNTFKYLTNTKFNFTLEKCKELDTILNILSQSDYEKLFFLKYNDIDAVNILQELIVYYLVSVYNIDAYNNPLIDKNICSLIISICNNNININMIPIDEMNWIHKTERLLESKVITYSDIELSPCEIKEHTNIIIENEILLLSDCRYISYAVCIGVLSYIKFKI
jgi:hypothetical protein